MLQARSFSLCIQVFKVYKFLTILIKGFSMNDPLTLLGRILVLCCIILSAPVLHFPCRKAIIVGIWGSEALPGGPKFSMTKWISTMARRIFQKTNNKSFFLDLHSLECDRDGPLCSEYKRRLWTRWSNRRHLADDRHAFWTSLQSIACF